MSQADIVVMTVIILQVKEDYLNIMSFSTQMLKITDVKSADRNISTIIH